MAIGDILWLVLLNYLSLYQEAELRLVKNLPDILTLQRDLVKKFQNISDLSFGTIAEFLNSQKAGTTVHTCASQLLRWHRSFNTRYNIPSCHFLGHVIVKLAVCTE